MNPRYISAVEDLESQLTAEQERVRKLRVELIEYLQFIANQFPDERRAQYRLDTLLEQTSQSPNKEK